MSDQPKVGDVLIYSFLWRWQAAQGETEGRKARPSAVAVRYLRKDGEDVVVLLPITSKPPEKHMSVLEVPLIERKRAGLDQDLPLWVVLDEYNLDRVEQSYYVMPENIIGQFSRRFLNEIRTGFRAAVQRGARKVTRYDD